MIEGNARPLNDEELADIELSARQHQSDFENYKQAYSYFFEVMANSLIQSYEG